MLNFFSMSEQRRGEFFMYKKLIAGFIMFCLILGLDRYLHVEKLLLLICQVMLGIFTYFIALMIEKDDGIRGLLSKFRSREMIDKA